MTIGVLLTNLGTPDAPTPQAVRKYLKEFLSDPRVVTLPRFIWFFILYGIILPFRSSKSARLYQKIWTPEGSPLLVHMQKLAQQLQMHLKDKDIVLSLGMRYGEPSLKNALEKLGDVDKIILLPLYPQYSGATTASTFDKVTAILKTWRQPPILQMVDPYYQMPEYIQAIAKSVENYWHQSKKTQKLLFSFHGLPQSFVEKGDPYEKQCRITAQSIAEKLGLSSDEWELAFQSRLGKAQWLTPYTDKVLNEWGAQKLKSVTVVCPGFSVDCLETLEEINMQNREFFLKAGGEEFHYVPALNESEGQIEMLCKLIERV